METPIITSLLDTDLYKFTMMQCIWHHFKEAQAVYRFKCRKPVDLSRFIEIIQFQLTQYCQLSLSKEELVYLGSLPYIKPDFVEFLSQFRLNPKFLTFSSANNLEIKIEGPWVDTILFEVPLLAIISETYFRHRYPNQGFREGLKRLDEKINYIDQPDLKHLTFSDFGTRRRFSKAWQETLLLILKEKCPLQFTGTSNVYFAKEFNLKPIGTMAHEFLQAFQVLAPSLEKSQQYALQIWHKEYQGALDIALTDVLTMDIFLEEFDHELASQYTGLRQDSGDPIEWGKKAIAHYQSLGIDPHNKTFVFSNGLTFPKMVKIFKFFQGKCKPQFGIGTNLTNDVGYDPLDIVIKLTQINHHPVVKISDSKGKLICDDDNYLAYVKKVFHLKD